jgi:hypothetical protein
MSFMARVLQNRHVVTGVCATMLAFAMPINASVAPQGFKSTLATPQQDATEKMVLRILADPRVRAARTHARKLLETNPLARSPDGKARLDHALDAWTTYLALQEANADPAHPAVIWTGTCAEYTWFGHTIPAPGASVDNPDNIYRHIPIDSASRYEIHGQLRPMHPTQFSFQLLRHANTIPVGHDNTSLGILNSRDMAIAADGSFIVTVDPDPANGRINHIQSPPGPLMRLLIRDTLTNWLQSPNDLTVKRVAGPATPAVTESTVTARVAEQLNDWVGGWLHYVSQWAGPPAENTLVAPLGRSGGWGYIAPMRFRLADDEAMIITYDNAASEYASIQLTDVWTIAPDPQKFVSSYTTQQSRRNTDGTYTYVVSVRDPGTANWIDPAGMHQGWVAIRWQGVPPTRTNSDGLLRDLRVVKISDLPSILPAEARGVMPEQRRREFEERTDEWRLRISAGE